MFVSRTRNSGMPCRSPLFSGWQKTSSATICTISVSRFAVDGMPAIFLEEEYFQSQSEASFCIADARGRGRYPSLCRLHPEKPAGISQAG